MGIGSAVNTAREAAESAIPSAESVKSAAINTCNGVIDTCKGSGSVTIEAKKALSALVDAPVGAVTDSLKACTQIVTLQPVKGVCTAMKGMGNMCKNVAKVMVSPVPTAVAAAKTTFNTGVAAAKIPGKAAVQAFDKISNCVNRTLDIYGPGGGGGSEAAANDNDIPAPAPAASSTPPAAAA